MRCSAPSRIAARGLDKSRNLPALGFVPENGDAEDDEKRQRENQRLAQIAR
jgi:hypothetical protein